MEMQQLIKEAKQGNSRAQRVLFDKLTGRMLIVCRRYVKSNEDAEELMLNGFYKFFQNLSDFQYYGEASVYAWLKKIIINECLMFMRSKNLFVVIGTQQAEELRWNEEAINNLSASEIFELIVQLPPGYRTVFNLYEVEGMAHKEIAILLGISEGTSKSQLSKAKAMLQKMLIQNDASHANKKSK